MVSPVAQLIVCTGRAQAIFEAPVLLSSQLSMTSYDMCLLSGKVVENVAFYIFT